MKAHIRITDDAGVVFKGEAVLLRVTTARAARRSPKAAVVRQTASQTTIQKVDFTKPERAFVKTYARGLSGPKKFVLVLSFLTKGEQGKEIEVKEIQRHWNKMTASNLLGAEYNGKYATVAKENGWVDATRHGVYKLKQSWKEVVEGNDG